MELYKIRSLLLEGKKLIDLPLKVTFYARVSTDQDCQLNSLENQIMYFKKYITTQKNWCYVDGYVDEGISGVSVNKRNQFLKMIEDAKEKKFDLILTKEISRFSRNTVDSINYTRMLLSFDVGTYFINDNINTFEADSELRLTIMSSIAQDEIRKLSERIRFGYKRSIEKGILPGNNNIYGYKKNKGKLEIIDEEAEIVKLIFEEYSKDKMGTAKLGYYLYEKFNIRSKTNKPLSGTVITRIIRNPKYKGYFCAHKETTIDYHTKKRIKFSPDEWIIYKDNETCPPIISEKLWGDCNNILNKHSKNYNSNSKTSLKYSLSGKIKCYHDGATFIRGNYKNKKTGLKIKYWGCSNYRKYGKKKLNGCDTPLLYYDQLLNIFKNILNEVLKDELLNDLYSDILRINKKVDYSNEVSFIDKKIYDIKKIKIELINMKAKKELDSKEFSEMKKRYDMELESLNKRKDYYKKNIQELNNEYDILNFKRKINSMLNNDDEVIFSIVSSIIEKILVEKKMGENKINLHFKLKIYGYEDSILTLNDFLLLFKNSNRCYSGNG